MRYLVTSALPYINGIKHLGNLVGSMLPADCYARFLRQEGEEVLYICATDEHGAPAEIAALEAEQDVAAYCDEQYEIQAEIYRRFNLSFDYFGRSSSRQNHELTRHIFERLDEAGFISEKTLTQLYSPEDGRFLPDRYVIGTCPHCGYERARGDQCEDCARLLDPSDLEEPRSALSGSRELEERESRHLFLRLGALEDRVRGWVEQQDQWPPLSRGTARKWLDEGLRERCITRDLDWGVPVPKPGYEDKVFYVWFDAPIAYIAATREWAEAGGDPEAWRGWWRDGEDVHYSQFMGKDNLPFHTVMFPATLLGADEGWKLPDQVKGVHWLNYYGGKFSTSAGRGVFMDHALELYPADYWRYYLMANVPERSDSSFTWELFASAVNKDLAGIFGNFVHRVFQFCDAKFGREIPEGGEPGPAESELASRCGGRLDAYRSAMREMEFRQAMRELRALWKLGNAYIDERAPWSALETDPDEARVTIRTCFNLIRLFAEAARPVVPDLADEVLTALRLDEDERSATLDEIGLSDLEGGRPFEPIPPVVEKVEEEEIERYEERFGS